MNRGCAMGTWTGRRAAGLMVAGAALFALPLWAADGATVGAPTASQPDARLGGSEGGTQGLAVLSGGVGREAQGEMRQKAGDYNLHVLFATRQGAYLANVAYSLADAGGKPLATGSSDGPWLYVKLPPGRYQLTAESNGMCQSRDVEVTAGKSLWVDFRFAD